MTRRRTRWACSTSPNPQGENLRREFVGRFNRTIPSSTKGTEIISFDGLLYVWSVDVVAILMCDDTLWVIFEDAC